MTAQGGVFTSANSEVERLRVNAIELKAKLDHAVKYGEGQRATVVKLDAEIERLKADNAAMFKSLDEQTTNALFAMAQWQEAEAKLAEALTLLRRVEIEGSEEITTAHAARRDAEARLAKVVETLKEISRPGCPISGTATCGRENFGGTLCAHCLAREGLAAAQPSEDEPSRELKRLRAFGAAAQPKEEP